MDRRAERTLRAPFSSSSRERPSTRRAGREMINTVNTAVQLGDPDDRHAPQRQAAPHDAPSAPVALAADSQPELRLVIEFDAEQNTMIYKMIDRATGAIVSQMSRDDLVRMSADPEYAAGAVIRTKA